MKKTFWTRQLNVTRNQYSWIIFMLLILIVFIGMDLRLQSVFRTRIVEPAIRADARDYVLYAYNLRNFGIYSRSDAGLISNDKSGRTSYPPPDAVRTPGYPLFMSIFIDHEITAKTIQTILLAQVFLGMLTIIFAFDLYRRFVPAAPLALIATFLTAISPHLVTSPIYLLTESLFCFLMVLSFWLFALAVEKQRLICFLLAGITMGASALTRPAVQYFIIPLALLFLFSRPVKFRLFAVYILGFILIFLPWTARNLYTLGKINDDTLKINALHHGLYPGFMYNDDQSTFGCCPYRYDPESPHISQSVDNALSEIKKRFTKDPAKYLNWYLVGKPVMLWSWNLTESIGGPFVYAVSQTPYTFLPHFKWSYILMHCLHWILVALGAIGCVIVWLPARLLGLNEPTLMILRSVALLMWYYVILHMIGAPFPRYSVPIRPFLYGMAMLPLNFVYFKMTKLVSH